VKADELGLVRLHAFTEHGFTGVAVHRVPLLH
jgi:hypothetical protein